MIYISRPGILPFRLPGTQALQAKSDFVTGHAPKITAAPVHVPTARHIYHGHKVVRQASAHRNGQLRPPLDTHGRSSSDRPWTCTGTAAPGVPGHVRAQQLRASLGMHGSGLGHGQLPCSRYVRAMATVSGHKVAFL